jgi:tRNA(Glu) U13 pseudouridine synthase TruD
LEGSYRKVISKPIDFKLFFLIFLIYSDLKKYSEKDQKLILTDFDIQKNISFDDNHFVGDLNSLIVSFTLNSSCYATMLIRELMHFPSSHSNFE